VPTIDGNWEIKTLKEDIEKGCIEENKRRFSQANNTPPLLKN
jgi:hypothetical protein